MNRPAREVSDRIAQRQCSRQDILSWNPVRQIDHVDRRIYSGDYTFHNADVRILQPEIGG